jgi:pimeloyl-ACP methyl ester carboxylesterase
MFMTRNHGRKAELVIVPGWAFDWRAFAGLDLPVECAYYVGETPQQFSAELRRWLRTRERKRISLLGWSMGAYAVTDFAANHPDMVEQLILVAARCRYRPQDIEHIRTLVHTKRKTFLRKFYRDCFSDSERPTYGWFRTTLLPDYLEEMTAEKLNRGLDWLSETRLDTASLQTFKNLVLVNGDADRIVPTEEVRKLAQAIPDAKVVLLKDAGHLPFLRKEFVEQVYGKA